MTNHFPEYSLVNEASHEVRRLIVRSVSGPGETILTQFRAGVPTEVVRGTEYETRKRADELAQEWTKTEGFRLTSDSNPIFEPLAHVTALARFMGHKVVYDGSFKDNRNLTGAVPLEQWPGMAANNGGGYQYSYTGTMILARPTLPPNHGSNIRPKTNEEMLDVMRKAVPILDAIGPAREFVLG